MTAEPTWSRCAEGGNCAKCHPIAVFTAPGSLINVLLSSGFRTATTLHTRRFSGNLPGHGVVIALTCILYPETGTITE